MAFMGNRILILMKAFNVTSPNLTNILLPPFIMLRLLGLIRHHTLHTSKVKQKLNYFFRSIMEDKGEKSSVVAAGSSPMDTGRNRGNEVDGDGSSGVRTVETLLRLLPVGLCVAALVVMLKDSESNEYGSLSYSNITAFKYLVHANGICAGYSLLSAAFTAIPRPITMHRAWTFFLLDQVLTYLILAAGAVATEVAYLTYKGDVTVTWSAVCGTYGVFCKKEIASIVITFVVVICYAVLSLISSYRLFSKYDAPVGYNNKGIEIVDYGN